MYKFRVVTQITNFTPGAFRFQLYDGSPVSVAEIAPVLENILLYPNPNQGQFAISTGVDLVNVNVELLDIQGRKIHQERANLIANNRKDISLDNAQAGMYFLRITDQNNAIIATQKVMID